MKVRFFLRNISRHPKFAPVQCRISHRGQKEFNTGLFIRPDNWDQKKQKDRTSKIDSFLKILEDKIFDIYNHDRPQNANDLFEILKKSHQHGVNDLAAALGAFVKHQQTAGNAKYTIDRYERAFKYWEEICNLPAARIQKHHVRNFYNHLRESMANNMAVKYLNLLKAIFDFGIGQEIIEANNPFSRHGFKLEEKEIVYLTADELGRIMEKDFSSSERLGIVRDIFIFQCFTGLEFERIKKLNENMIFQSDNGKAYIRTSRQKSGVSSSVRIWPEAMEIMNKYEDHVCRQTGLIFPVRSNQKMNEYLKEIAAICTIEKHLTTHKARHTFATTVCLDRGASMEYTSKQLGHKSIKTTQRNYAVISDKRILSEDEQIESRFYPDES